MGEGGGARGWLGMRLESRAVAAAKTAMSMTTMGLREEWMVFWGGGRFWVKEEDLVEKRMVVLGGIKEEESPFGEWNGGGVQWEKGRWGLGVE